MLKDSCSTSPLEKSFNFWTVLANQLVKQNPITSLLRHQQNVEHV